MDPSSELAGVVGFHEVTKEQARELIQPYMSTDGYYLLRPSSDAQGGILCTICVTNRQKLMNYRLKEDRATGRYYIYKHTPFTRIFQLIDYYRSTPINAESNIRLLHPVASKQQEQLQEPEDCYVIMERPDTEPTPASKDPPLDSATDFANRGDLSGQSNGSDIGEIPGLHMFLPKAEIKNVMQPYLSHDGCYLLRPSSTSEGQLTMAVSHGGQVLNFKIASENGQYYITPKRRFNSVQELLAVYRTSPIRSKRSSQKILLFTPIHVDPNLEKHFKKQMTEKAAKQNQPEPLPQPWQEHWHDQFRRAYYYNPTTGESVWERPTPPTKTRSLSVPTNQPSPRHTRRVQDRRLPTTPEVGATPTVASSRKVSSSAGGSRKRDQPLPTIPAKDSTPPELPPPRAGSDKRPPRIPPAERDLPPLPPKETSNETPIRRGLPPLPPKKQDSPVHTGLPRRESAAKGLVPPLPPKQPETVGRPPLPPKEPERELPPLPPKEDRPLPPLPPKSSEGPETIVGFPNPSPVQPPISGRKRNKKKAVVEYEDHVLPHQLKNNQSPSVKSPPLPDKGPAPPLPEKTPSGAAPPPPINIPASPPGANVPAPPPPPPSLPPPSPIIPHIKPKLAPPESPSTGRLFTATDLSNARTLLKKSPDLRRSTVGGSGLAGVFANAIDTRMNSIRRAVTDSDDESEFEDVDDDWD